MIGDHSVEKPIEISQTYEAFYAFLKYFYLGFLDLSDKLDLQDIMDLVELGDQHMIHYIKNSCEIFLIRNHEKYIQLENVCEVVQYANHWKLLYLKNHCIKLMKTLAKATSNLPGYNDLPESIKKECREGTPR
jgi:hypothetical protein